MNAAPARATTPRKPKVQGDLKIPEEVRMIDSDCTGDKTAPSAVSIAKTAEGAFTAFSYAEMFALALGIGSTSDTFL